MIKRDFKCEDCGCRFTEEVFEPEEAKEERMSARPVKCPECRSGTIKEI